MMQMKELGVCSTDGDRSGELSNLSAQFFTTNRGDVGIFNPSKYSRQYLNAEQSYQTIVSILTTIRRKFNEQRAQEQEEGKEEQQNQVEPYHIAINANACAVSETPSYFSFHLFVSFLLTNTTDITNTKAPSFMSYPTFMSADRALQNFNLDFFYNACADANVQCKHIYIYRDPYDVIKSTSTNRHFNSNIYDSIRLYTSVLQQIHSQLVSFPDRNLGCFGFLDAKGHSIQQDWERFGSLWGWETFDEFMGIANEINSKSR